MLDYGSEIPALAGFSSGYATYQLNYPCYCYYDRYIFSVLPYTGTQGSNIIKYDVITGARTIINVDTSITVWQYGGQPSFSVGKYIYMFYPVGVVKLDVVSNEFTFKSASLLSWPFPNTSRYFSSGCVSGTKIFLFGSSVSTTSTAYVCVYDAELEDFTFSENIDSKISGTCYSSCVAVGSKLYIIGGSSPYTFDPSKYVQTYDIETGEISRNDILPLPVDYTCRSIRHGKYAYVLGDRSDGKNITKIDLENLTAEVLQNSFSGKSISSAVGFANGKWYIIGLGDNAYTFTLNTPLQSNNLFLQADFGFDNPFPLINDGKTKILAYLRNAYLGDSNNIAQLTNAYLYDSKDLKWKSLSGESYVADMQNALNILGVN